MLLDHFHPPLSNRRDWHGFHNTWASAIVTDLNRRLPRGVHAAPDIRFGIEVDVGVVEEPEPDGPDDFSGTWAEETWQPPEPVLVADFSVTTDVVEVQIVNHSYNPPILAAIELVSPANKDRPAHRDAFVSKCETLLRDGAGLIVVDVVTDRHADLHHELATRLDLPRIDTSRLYAAAYRVRRDGESRVRHGDESDTQLDVWYESLELGVPLPTLPLFLRVGPMLGIDLDATYRSAAEMLRIPIPAPAAN